MPRRWVEQLKLTTQIAVLIGAACAGVFYLIEWTRPWGVPVILGGVVLAWIWYTAGLAIESQAKKNKRDD